MHVLRQRDFGLFLGGRFASVLAAQMQWVANGWYLYDLTGDPMTLGWAGLAAFLPIAILTLPAGDLADRVDRRWILGVAHFIQALAAALLLVLVAMKTSVTWPFYCALVLSGSTRALAGPASKSLAPLLVPREQFAQSVAWATSAQQTAIIAGPALGGLLYLLGAPVTFAACFVLALLPEQRQPHAGRALFGGVACFGAGAIVFALSGSFWLSLAALAMMGAGDAMSVFVRATLVQLATPQEMRGRVSAIHVLFVGCTNELGEFRAGLLASLFGAVPAALAGGIGTLVIVGLWTQLFPSLRKVDRLSEVAPRKT